MSRKPTFRHYDAPAGGWGSARSLGNVMRREGVLASAPLTLARHNKVDGYQCNSCAWVKPANPLPFEYCENGAKAVAWEITSHRCTPDFFAKYTVTELLAWDDCALEQVGRLTHPMRYDAGTDTYVPVDWDTAIQDIARELRAVPDPKQTVFYSSGRMCNEASYLYGLFARLYGNNNLPDSSNMCHETTSVALPASIGVPVGTVTLEDFGHAECLLFFGQNPGSNAPRMLHPLQHAAKRGVPIITFNPLRERGLERFTNPQSPTEMLTGSATRISSAYHQVKTGGDLAALTGICKAVFALDDAARAGNGPRVIDREFVDRHTNGFESFERWARAQEWDDIERRSGLPREDLEATAATYCACGPTIAVYGMGLTQHQSGVETIRLLINLLLLRGNIGRTGAGICPVRGHSNVQGQRTVGITERPELVPMDTLAKQYDFEPPREKGYETVESCEAILAGKVRAFLMFGGNFVRAIPEHGLMEPAWRNIHLTVNVATKLNRSHLVHGKISYILPVKSRIEVDRQGGVAQALSVEDTSSCVHGSRGVRFPASKHLLSEVEVLIRIAKATLPPNPKVTWDAWLADYSRIRASIAETYPEIFHDYETRMREPGGFHRPMPVRERIWKTPSGRAEFITPTRLEGDPKTYSDDKDVFRLMTLRSNDQFNTTVYGYDDRFRGINGTRMIVFMNQSDIDRLGLAEGATVTLATSTTDGVKRELHGLRVTPYSIPPGCLGAYYPEANVLLPLWHHAEGSHTPAAKSIPVTVRRQGQTAPA
jgi:molybdopterin-dependent oxidoreductase alpha subunit